MGSCISPTLARIVMDVVIKDLLKKVPQISFIKVFVDDTIAAMDFELIDKALDVLNNFRPNQIKFTKEIEQDGSINFLNVTIKRTEISISPLQKDFILITKWYRKHFASGRLVNFHSLHKKSTV